MGMGCADTGTGGRPMTDLLTRLLALAELAVSEALEFDYGDPEDRYIWRELQELKPLVQQAQQ